VSVNNNQLIPITDKTANNRPIPIIGASLSDMSIFIQCLETMILITGITCQC